MSRINFHLSGLIIAAALGLMPAAGSALEAPEATESAAQFVDLLGSRYGVQPNLTYSIANNVELKLDLYLPMNTSAPVPLVMLFHGGGWVDATLLRP